MLVQLLYLRAHRHVTFLSAKNWTHMLSFGRENEMKNRAGLLFIPTAVAMLLGFQVFAQCWGDEGGTFAGGTFVAYPNSPTIDPAMLGDGSGTTTMEVATCAGTATMRALPPLLPPSGLITSADAGLLKADAGTLTLAANNTYTGGTSINSGMLQLGSGASLGESCSINCFTGATTICSGTLDLSRGILQPKPITVQVPARAATGQLSTTTQSPPQARNGT